MNNQRAQKGFKKRFSKYSDLSSGVSSNLDAVQEEREEELNNSKDVINMEQIMENVKKKGVPKDVDGVKKVKTR